MAHVFNVNTIPATGAACMYAFLAALLAQTWTKTQDSDGTTYSAGGLRITSGSAGANGLGNTSAWFVVRDPNSVRSFCFQRGGSNLLWRTKYSASAGFTGGTPSATQVPSATDEQTLQGGGTDAVPTFQTFFDPDGTQRFNCCAGDSTVGYAFFWNAFPVGNALGSQFGMCMDVMAAGGFAPADTDPAIIYLINKGNGGSNLAWAQDFFATQTTTFAFFSNTHTAANWRACVPLTYVDSATTTRNAPGAGTVGAGMGTNPFSGKDDGLPIAYARDPSFGGGGPIGFKGYGLFLRWSGANRANYDTISNTGVGSRDKIWNGGCLLPWNGSLPLI